MSTYIFLFTDVTNEKALSDEKEKKNKNQKKTDVVI